MKPNGEKDFVGALNIASGVIDRTGAPPYIADWGPGDLAGLLIAENPEDLPHDRSDRAARSVIAGALWAQRSVPVPLTFEEEVETLEDRSRGRLARLESYLRHVAPNEVPLSQIAWEINAAGVAGLTDRLLVLIDRLGAESSNDPRGLTICAWNQLQLILAHDDFSEKPWGAIPWTTLLHHEQLWQAIVLMDAAKLVLRNADGFFGREPRLRRPTVRPDWSAMLGARLAQLNACGTVPDPLRVGWQVVAFLEVLTSSGDRRQRFRQLASDFRGHAAEVQADIPEFPLQTTTWFGKASAALLYLAGDYAEATKALEALAVDMPEDRDLWRALATCADASGEVAMAVNAVEKASADQPDIVSRLAIVFGNERLEYKRKLDQLEETLWQAEVRKVDERLLATLQPFTIHMSEQSRSKWYTAVRIASLPELQSWVGWDPVAGSARSALEIDIDDKLMKPMVDTGVELVEPDDKLSRTWDLIRQGRANLGGQLSLLRSIHRADPRTQQLRAWLSLTFPDFVKGQTLVRFIKEADRVRETGNEGVHESVDEAAARAAIDSTSDLLAFLHRVTRQEQ